MGSFEFKIAVKSIDQAFVSCKSFKGNFIYEISGILRHEDMNISTVFNQHADKGSGLVCSNTSRNAHQNSFISKHFIHFPYLFQTGLRTQHQNLY